MAFKVLKNKYVFYTVFVIAIANLLGYLSMQDYESLTLFVILYALATYFSKRTIVNLSVAILGTALLRHSGVNKVWPWYEREGMSDSSDNQITKQKGKEGKAKGGKAKAKDGKKKKNTEKEHFSAIHKHMSKLDNGGLDSLKNGTSQLTEQQKALMGQMANMEPLIKNAENLLKTFESSGMMKMVDKVLPFVEKIALPGMGGMKT